MGGSLGDGMDGLGDSGFGAGIEGLVGGLGTDVRRLGGYGDAVNGLNGAPPQSGGEDGFALPARRYERMGTDATPLAGMEGNGRPHQTRRLHPRRRATPTIDTETMLGVLAGFSQASPWSTGNSQIGTRCGKGSQWMVNPEPGDHLSARNAANALWRAARSRLHFPWARAELTGVTPLAEVLERSLLAGGRVAKAQRTRLRALERAASAARARAKRGDRSSRDGGEASGEEDPMGEAHVASPDGANAMQRGSWAHGGESQGIAEVPALDTEGGISGKGEQRGPSIERAALVVGRHISERRSSALAPIITSHEDTLQLSLITKAHPSLEQRAPHRPPWPLPRGAAAPVVSRSSTPERTRRQSGTCVSCQGINMDTDWECTVKESSWKKEVEPGTLWCGLARTLWISTRWPVS